jgi:hypothetical protein
MSYDIKNRELANRWEQLHDFRTQQLNEALAINAALSDACKEAHALLRRMGGKNHDPEYSQLERAIDMAEGNHGR